MLQMVVIVAYEAGTNVVKKVPPPMGTSTSNGGGGIAAAHRDNTRGKTIQVQKREKRAIHSSVNHWTSASTTERRVRGRRSSSVKRADPGVGGERGFISLSGAAKNWP